MPKKPYLYPHDLLSEGATSLANKFNAKKVLPDGKYKPKVNEHIVINWGSSIEPNWDTDGLEVLNSWKNIAVSVNKLKTFEKLKEAAISIPDFTTDIEIAKGWIGEGLIVVCREKLTGSQGEGITIAKSIEELVQAKLYTKYIKKKYEQRVHVMNGKVFDFTQKKKRIDWDIEQKGEVNPYVRNFSNGWVFCREGVILSPIVKEECIKAVKALDLFFGAIDIVYNERLNKAFILEINAAPGLQGATLESYYSAFNNYINGIEINDVVADIEVINEPGIINNIPVNQNPVIVAPNPIPAPIQPQSIANAPMPVVAAPIGVPVANQNNNRYSLDGITNVVIKFVGNVTKVFGSVLHVPHQLKIMEITNGVVTFWWAEQENE